MGELYFSNLVTKSLQPINSDDRYFEGYLTVQMKDKQNEITIVEELYKVLPIWMDRGAPISDTHSNRIIGKGINYAKTIYKADDGTEYPAIKMTGKIYKNYELDNEIWNRIKSGEYKGLSFGGATRSNRTPMVMKDGSIAYALKDLEHYEVAVCKDPAVPLALITDFNPVAKAMAGHTEERGDGRMVIKCSKFGCFIEKAEVPEGVELNKPIREEGGEKKFKVYVKDPKTGNIKIVRFGDPNMEIKRDDPERRESFRARHDCENATDITTPQYWSCKMWEKDTSVTEYTQKADDEEEKKMKREREIKDILDEANWKAGKPGVNPHMIYQSGIPEHQIEMGTKVEMEHTSDEKEARKIAMDHLREDPYYYTKLGEAMPKEKKIMETIKAKKIEHLDPDERSAMLTGGGGSGKDVDTSLLLEDEKPVVEKPVKKSEYITKPFGGYKDFDACVKANQDKDDPSAYCGYIKHQVEKADDIFKKNKKGEQDFSNANGELHGMYNQDPVIKASDGTGAGNAPGIRGALDTTKMSDSTQITKVPNKKSRRVKIASSLDDLSFSIKSNNLNIASTKRKIKSI